MSFNVIILQHPLPSISITTTAAYKIVLSHHEDTTPKYMLAIQRYAMKHNEPIVLVNNVLTLTIMNPSTFDYYFF